MKFLVHEGPDITGPIGWYESDVDVVAGNTIALLPDGKTFTVDNRADGETMAERGARPITQVWLFCTRSNVSADEPGVIQLTVADRPTPR